MADTEGGRGTHSGPTPGLELAAGYVESQGNTVLRVLNRFHEELTSEEMFALGFAAHSVLDTARKLRGLGVEGP